MGTAPNPLLSVLLEGLSPSTKTLASSTDSTRFSSMRSSWRGSRNHTNSPTPGKRFRKALGSTSTLCPGNNVGTIDSPTTR